MRTANAAIAGFLIAIVCTPALAVPARAQEASGPPGPPGLVRLGDPETGSLLLKSAQDGLYLEAPQVAMDAALDVTGPIVRARITQRFENPSDQWVEGVYVFPLPEDSGVDTLKIQIGDRFIEGRIEERGEARRIYEAARDEGRRAGLVEQERPNMFTTSVANIGPGETVVVQIEYQDAARLDDGTWSLRLPLVVGPRYSPAAGGFQTVAYRDGAPVPNDPVPDRARISPPVLHPDDEPSADGGALRLPVSIRAEIAPGFAMDSVRSPYHAVAAHYEDQRSAAFIELADGPIPADRDFVLEWRAASAEPAAALFTETVDGQTYVLGVIAPPAAAPARGERPIRETVFVIDNSGSMAGPSMDQAKAALLSALDGLGQDDWFNVIRFDNTIDMVAPFPVAADARELDYARAFVARLDAQGGTEMLPALRAALHDPRPDPLRVRQVVFLTDGAIGNEAQLFQEIERGLGRSRLFTVGIGSAPNSYFMSRTARLGRGSFLHIGDVGEVEAKAGRLFEMLEAPVLTDLALQAPEGALSEIWPTPLPDLYAGEPVVFTARLAGDAQDGAITIAGRRGDRAWSAKLDLADARQGQGVAKLWARDKIAAIEERRFAPNADYEAIDAAVLETALAHGLVSRRTSLVAVDATPARPEGAPLASADVPTMLPAGWDFGKVFAVPPPAPVDYAARAPLTQLAARADPGLAAAMGAPGLTLPQTAALVPLRVLAGLIGLLAGGAVLLVVLTPKARER